MPALLIPKLDEMLLDQVDAAVGQSVVAAASEFGFVLVKGYVSQWGGNLAANCVAPLTNAGATALGLSVDPYSFAVLGSGVLIGVGVDYAINKAVEASGHDPAGKLAAKIDGVLRKAQIAVFEGSDPERASRYVWFTIYSKALAGSEEGAVCDFAARAAERSDYIGLRPTLTALHGERLCIRRRLVYESIFAAPMPAEQCLTPRQAAESGEVIEAAREIRTSETARLFESLLAD